MRVAHASITMARHREASWTTCPNCGEKQKVAGGWISCRECGESFRA